MNKKTEIIAWFYPVWSLLWIVAIPAILLGLGNGYNFVVPVAMILLLSELPIIQYKRGGLLRVTMEIDTFFTYSIGVGSAALLVMFDMVKTDSGLAVMVGLAAVFLIWFKTVVVHSYSLG